MTFQVLLFSTVFCLQCPAGLGKVKSWSWQPSVAHANIDHDGPRFDPGALHKARPSGTRDQNVCTRDVLLKTGNIDSLKIHAESTYRNLTYIFTNSILQTAVLPVLDLGGLAMANGDCAIMCCQQGCNRWTHRAWTPQNHSMLSVEVHLGVQIVVCKRLWCSYFLCKKYVVPICYDICFSI